jgi:hypothetical protein
VGIGSEYRLLTGSIPKEKLAEEAVISEPVSARSFPVLRENTAKSVKERAWS